MLLLLSLVSSLLPVLTTATVGPDAETETYHPGPHTSQHWWPSPPFHSQPWPVSPDRTTTTATTSLTDIPTYTPSPWSTTTTTKKATSTSPPYPSSPANSTLPACKKIQYDFPAGQGGNPARAEAVKEAYVYAWDAYKKYAFPRDELLPLNKGGINDWYGWGVTVVDGIDTAIVMNLTDIVAEQLAYIATIDFQKTPYGPVEIFDTNIRYIGGLLSAYDLLNSGLFPAPYPKKHIDALLDQAVSLANKVAFGFDSPSGLASVDVDFNLDEPVFGTYTIDGVTYNSTNTASTGTFILEWARLSDLTGNETYRELTERAESILINPSPKPVYPGLVGTQFDTVNGDMLTFDGGWHAGVDSFLEYLIKTYQYKQTPVTKQYKDFWLQAVQSTIEHIALAPYGFPDLKFISELDVNGSIAWTEDDFTCFCGGNFFLGGSLLGMSDIVDLAVEATDSCHWTYNHSTTGLGPIEWQWYNATNLAYDPLNDNDGSARKNGAHNGYFIPYGAENWESRPEEIESIFYGHRITGDPRWAEYNWQIFQAINATARNDVAFATVNNVDMPFGGSQSNSLDSFFFAEVLKYLYLTFADPQVVSLDQFVFNTECHPLLVQCGIGGKDDDSYSAPATGTVGSKTTTTPTTTSTTTSTTTL